MKMADKNLTLANNDGNEITEAIERLYQAVHGIIENTRAKVWRAVNDGQVSANWEIGRAIVEEEQRGEERADYGKRLIDALAERLAAERGRGFSATNLKYMRLFYRAFPIRHAVRDELTWTHYRLIMTVENERARTYYILDNENFYIDLVFYHRLARCFVLIDLKTGKLTHQDLGQMQMYVHYYQREMMADGENPLIGLVLCADKSEAVVKYTLPENNTQIFASRYRLHLPTEEELTRKIMREREIFEREQRLALAAEM